MCFKLLLIPCEFSFILLTDKYRPILERSDDLEKRPSKKDKKENGVSEAGRISLTAGVLKL